VLPLTFLALVLALSPLLFTPRNLINVLHQAAILSIVTVGMTYVSSAAEFDLSIGANVALSGCVGAVVMLQAGVAAGVLAGLRRRARHRAAERLPDRLPPPVALHRDARHAGHRPGLAWASPRRGDLRAAAVLPLAGLGARHPVPVVLAALTFAVGWVFLRFHPFGVLLYAVGGNSQAARLGGIRVGRVILVTYAASGFLAAVAGLTLTSRVRAGEPTVAVFLELFRWRRSCWLARRGGSGSLPRSTLGVLFIGSLENGLNLLNVPFYWQQVVIGGVFIVAAAMTSRRLAGER
jgi:ribose/xylose/arabinose/galactoside ABC-type transport system permease subunit